jgi:farnesol dehydrogenase
MKCFLTGITGFIGSHLARRLVADGHSVNAIIRRPAPESLAKLPGVRLFNGDLHDRPILDKAMEGCETAFHLAAFAKPWSKDPGEFGRVNVAGAVNVFAAALESGIKKAVFTSSAATISPSLGRQPANEASPKQIPFFNAYEATKTEAEIKAREFCRNGLPVVIVNPSRVYGPGPLNPSNSLTRMIAGYLEGTWRIIPGDGKKIGNYVFIDDVVEGHVLALLKGRPGERYILGGENLTFHEFFRILEEVSSIHRRMIHLPLAVMTSAAKFLVWQNRVTGIPPVITADFVKKYLNHWSLSSDKAIHELGYRITPFRAGAKKTLEWLDRRSTV